MTCTIRRRWWSRALRTCVFIAAHTILYPIAAQSATFEIDCDAGDTIGGALAKVRPGDTMLVSGTCNENLIVDQQVSRLTLDGQGRAIINGGAADKTHTVIVRLLDNRIEGNRGNGVVLNENSVARIGFNILRDKAHPNTIEGNALDGIFVQRSSTAWIAGAVIRGNKGNGVAVDRHSQVTLGGNAIDGNGGDAIAVSRLSGVTLGNMDIRRDGPNTTKQKNGGAGIRCFMGGYVDGSVSTLDGAKGTKQFETACSDGTTP